MRRRASVAVVLVVGACMGDAGPKFRVHNGCGEPVEVRIYADDAVEEYWFPLDAGEEDGVAGGNLPLEDFVVAVAPAGRRDLSASFVPESEDLAISGERCPDDGARS